MFCFSSMKWQSHPRSRVFYGGWPCWQRPCPLMRVLSTWPWPCWPRPCWSTFEWYIGPLSHLHLPQALGPGSTGGTTVRPSYLAHARLVGCLGLGLSLVWTVHDAPCMALFMCYVLCALDPNEHKHEHKPPAHGHGHGHCHAHRGPFFRHRAPRSHQGSYYVPSIRT